MALYRIAGLSVEMQPRFALTQIRAKKYLVENGTPDLCITADYDCETGEYAELAKALYARLIRYDAFFLHSSAVELNGRAYLFSAPSGTGKSTHAAFWKSRFGASVINDDKPIIRLIDGVFHACGTPFSGKTDQNENRCVPLGGIAFLRRASNTDVTPMQSVKALWSLLDQTLRPTDTAQYDRLLSLLEKLITEVPIYRLDCTNEPSAADMAKNAMVK